MTRDTVKRMHTLHTTQKASDCLTIQLHVDRIVNLCQLQAKRNKQDRTKASTAQPSGEALLPLAIHCHHPSNFQASASNQRLILIVHAQPNVAQHLHTIIYTYIWHNTMMYDHKNLAQQKQLCSTIQGRKDAHNASHTCQPSRQLQE
jgi:hypothetical protein